MHDYNSPHTTPRNIENSKYDLLFHSELITQTLNDNEFASYSSAPARFFRSAVMHDNNAQSHINGKCERRLLSPNGKIP